MHIQNQATSVVIAKQNRLLGDCLKEMLLLQGFRVVGHTTNGRQALRLLRIHRPHLALLGVELPEMDGIKIINEVRKENLPTRCIIYAHRFNSEFLANHVNRNIPGLILSESSFEELLNCLELVANGERYITPHIENFLNRSFHNKANEEELLFSLTEREREVMQLIGEGLTMRGIAEALHISPATVNNHRANISKKLNLSGRNSLLQYATIMKNSRVLL